MITKDGFTIEWRDQVVTISKSVKNGESFDEALEEARSLLLRFKAGIGSTWGCDGVGYTVQKRIGMVRVNRSGVTMRNYQNALAAIRDRTKNVKA